MSLPAYLRHHRDGAELALRVTPKAGRAAIIGSVRDAAGNIWLSVKVSEAAEAGRATDAVMRLVARQCQVSPSAVRLLAGATSRWKRLLVAGDTTAIAERLAGANGEPA